MKICIRSFLIIVLFLTFNADLFAKNDLVDLIVFRHGDLLKNYDYKKFFLGLSIQKTDARIPGGLGDFAAQAGKICLNVDWIVPLTDFVNKQIIDDNSGILVPELSGDSLSFHPFRGIENERPFAVYPIYLNDPVTGEKHRFDMEFYPVYTSNNLTIYVTNKDLFGKELHNIKPVYKTTHTSTGSIYEGIDGKKFLNGKLLFNPYGTIEENPDLAKIHPLLRRYLGNGPMLSQIIQSSVSKATIKLLNDLPDKYRGVWVQDHHFASIMGELLLPENDTLRKSMLYVQHVHNIIWQGIVNDWDIIKILNWPVKEYLNDKRYLHNGQVNMLAGAFKAINDELIEGKVAFVSENHVNDVITKARGAGIYKLLREMQKNGYISGINNPIIIPDAVKQINKVEDIVTKKHEFKDLVQDYFELKKNKRSLLVLWNHRFTQQKQNRAFLNAVNRILEEGHNIQFAIFADVHIGSEPKDVRKLMTIIKKYPGKISNKPFNQRLEMLISGGVDANILPTDNEPFGYGPVWTALQGGLVLTTRIGGQVDIFKPTNIEGKMVQSAIFMDLMPDVSDPYEDYSYDWFLNRYLYPPKYYQQKVLKYNSNAIYEGILKLYGIYRDPRKRIPMQMSAMKRIQDLAKSKYFKDKVDLMFDTSKIVVEEKDISGNLDRVVKDYSKQVSTLCRDFFKKMINKF